MKKRILGTIIALTSIFAVTSCTLFNSSSTVYDDSNAKVEEISTSITDVVKKVEPGCVAVTCSSGVTNSGSLGSGVIFKKVDNTYYVLTNYHVVGDFVGIESSNYYVYVGSNAHRIKARLTGALAPAKDLAVISFESSDDLTVNEIKTDKTPIVQKGETVIAIGCPLSLDYYNSVCSGVVSKDVYTSNNTVTYNGKSASTTIKVIQTTCPINPGNSGGGLFNLKGELVGINFKKTTYTTEGNDRVVVDGLNYTISLEEVKAFLANNKNIFSK
jgi:S1-C subfamily serine protease